MIERTDGTKAVVTKNEPGAFEALFSRSFYEITDTRDGSTSYTSDRDSAHDWADKLTEGEESKRWESPDEEDEE